MTSTDTTHLKASLLDAEEARRLAMQDNNAQKLDTMMADSMTYVHSSGIIDNKQAYLLLLSSGTVTYENVVFDKLNVKLMGQVGMISGTMKASLMRGGNRKQIATAYLAIWEHQNGEWQLQAVQATSLPAAA